MLHCEVSRFRHVEPASVDTASDVWHWWMHDACGAYGAKR